MPHLVKKKRGKKRWRDGLAGLESFDRYTQGVEIVMKNQKKALPCPSSIVFAIHLTFIQH
jgi:hypothetical protein